MDVFKTMVTAALSLILGAGAVCVQAGVISASSHPNRIGNGPVIPQEFADGPAISTGVSFQNQVDFRPKQIGLARPVSAANIPQVTVKFTGSMNHTVISTWDDIAPSLKGQQPDGSSDKAPLMNIMRAPVVHEVRAPMAFGQSMAGVFFVMLLTLVRITKRISVTN